MRRVEAMLKELKQAAGLDGRLTGSILDQGDAVGAWQSDSMAVIVFPTAETLKQVCLARRQLRCWAARVAFTAAHLVSEQLLVPHSTLQVMTMADARQDGLVMLVNPQWQPGQVQSASFRHQPHS